MYHDIRKSILDWVRNGNTTTTDTLEDLKMRVTLKIKSNVKMKTAYKKMTSKIKMT